MEIKNKKEVPTLVKIISIIDYLVGGFIFIFGSIFAFSIVMNLLLGNLLGFLVLLLISLSVIIPSIFFVILGWNLWKGKNWARITQIIISSMGVTWSLVEIIQGSHMRIYGIVLPSLIVGYLILNEDVKIAFN